MGFKEDCEAAVSEIVRADFNVRYGGDVPRTESVVQENGAVSLTAAYLYADMADSTGMAARFSREDAAKIIRAYLAAVCRVLRDRGGEIRSFDGDRVMAIFVGDDAADKAVDAGLRIAWVVDELVHWKLTSWNDAYKKNWIEGEWKLSHRTGIDLGVAFIVRAGVRGNNDLVSIGSAPNIAAKLSDFKGGGRTIITDYVWDKLSYSNRWSKNSESDSDVDEHMWTTAETTNLSGTWQTIRTSSWRRSYS